MEYKTFDFEIKELTEEGKFSGYLSTFGNIDDGGDIVDSGAFKKTLKESKAFPLYWHHQVMDMDAAIGSFEAREDEKGLFINGEFFIDQDAGLKAYKLVKKYFEKLIKIGLSMGYKIIKDAIEKIEGGYLRHLKEVKLKEGSITLFPMNKLAGVTQVKDEGDQAQEDFSYEQKPYPNEHACRLQDPGKYERFTRGKRKSDGKEYSIIFGWKKDGKSEEQAYRYNKETWSASEAKSHCADHDGSFEAASKQEALIITCPSCGETLELESEEVSTQLESFRKNDEPDNEFHSALKKIAEKLKS